MSSKKPSIAPGGRSFFFFILVLSLISFVMGVVIVVLGSGDVEVDITVGAEDVLGSRIFLLMAGVSLGISSRPKKI